MAMARESAATRSTVSAEAKLALLEELQRSGDLASAAQSTAEWLVAHAGADRTIVAAADHGQGKLAGIAGAGVSPRQYKKLSLSLDELDHPLVNALANGSSISFHSSADARLPLFGDTAFTSVKIGGAGDDPAVGLILISPAVEGAASMIKWAAAALGHSVQRVAMPPAEPLDDDP